MTRFLNRLFNIRSEEWPRVMLLFSMAALSQAGSVWGPTIAYAAFLKQIGLAALPYVLILSSVLSIVAIAVYSAFVDRISNSQLTVALYAISATTIVIGLVLLEMDMPAVAYPFLYLFYLTLLAARNPHFTTYVNSFYDIQSAKRVLPVVSAGFRTGAVIGGLTMPLLTAWLSSPAIIAAWLASFLLVMGLVVAMPYLLKERTRQSKSVSLATPTAVAKQPASYVDNVREGFRYTAESTYLRWIAAGTFLLMILLALIEYASTGIMLKTLGTSKELANYLAVLGAVANFAVLPVLLFGMSRLITWLGLGNAKLVFPAINLAACGGLVFAPGLVSASGAYLDRTAFKLAFQSPIDNLLYNAVPLRMRGRARAFASGLIEPIGSLIGGLLLLLPLISMGWFVPLLIVILAFAYTVSAWFTRHQYGQALIQLLEQEDYSFLLSQEASDLSGSDPATLAQLQKKLEESQNREITIFIAQLIAQTGGSQAIPILERVAQAATDARTRSAIVDVLVAADLRDDAVRQLYLNFLSDPDGQVRQSAIAGLERVDGSTDKQFRSRLLEMLNDPDVNVRVRALSALADSGDLHESPAAAQMLDQFLADPDPHVRVQGVRVLGPIGSERAIRQLIERLNDPADEVRLEATLQVEAWARKGLPDPTKPAVVDNANRLLRDPVERARQAALTILGRAGARQSYQTIVEALADASPQVRETAADELVRAGKSIIPVLHPKLNAANPQLCKMAAVVLSRVNPKEFGPVITSTNVTGNLLAIYRNYGLAEALAPCSSYSGIAMLQTALREHSHQLSEEIFYFLTAIHEQSAVKIISESLHSQDPHVRANAVEALETTTSPQIARLVAPLFEPNPLAAELLSLSKETWDMEQPDTTGTLQQLATQVENPWFRTITAFAVGEMGAALAPKKKPEPPPKTEGRADEAGKRKPRRSLPTDLLGALADTAEAKPEAKSAEPKERSARRSPPSDLLGVLTDSKETKAAAPASAQADTTLVRAPNIPFALPEIESMLAALLNDPVDEVRRAAQAAQQTISRGNPLADLAAGGAKKTSGEDSMLSTIEKIIFLKEVPFFQGMTIDQLKVLANVCEEELFEKDTRIYNKDDPGGVLYVVVSGRVGIEQEKRAGSFARLANIETHSYFGEMNLFDNSPRSTSAIALQDTLTLRLRREPLIALARQHPDLSLELINVLSQRLRETSDRIAELTRSRPRELHKLYDQFD